MRVNFDKHKIKYLFFALICLCGVLLLEFVNKNDKKSSNILQDVRVNSKDKCICVTWNMPPVERCKYIQIDFYKESALVYSDIFTQKDRGCEFVDGEHGDCYEIYVTPFYTNGNKGPVVEMEALFLDYSLLPKLPIISIDTEDGADPTYTNIEPPSEGIGGMTMRDNEYVQGEMILREDGAKTISSGLKIRVRGNTSSVQQRKKSYKIKLDTTCALLGDNIITSNEWVLLNSGRELNTYIGSYVGELCGMEWTLDTKFVNLMLNGDWKGCYYLIPSVSVDNSHGLVDKDGYLFENDSYWWNSDGLYFKTNNQGERMGYTISYPEILSVNDKEFVDLQNHIEYVSGLIERGDDDYRFYIDEASFATWVLAHDILGITDGHGSNIFFYIHDFNSTNNKIKMGPLWDFDSAYLTGDAWSNCRTDDIAYFGQLYRFESFRNEYFIAWENIYPKLCEKITEKLAGLDEIGVELDKSWELDYAHWNREILPYEIQKKNTIEWFEHRVDVINRKLEEEKTTYN